MVFMLGIFHLASSFKGSSVLQYESILLFYCQIMFHSVAMPIDGNLEFSHFGVTMNNAINIYVQVSVIYVMILLGIYLEV